MTQLDKPKDEETNLLWGVKEPENSDSLHVVPINDFFDHPASVYCICRPVLQKVDPVTYQETWGHKMMRDKRNQQ